MKLFPEARFRPRQTDSGAHAFNPFANRLNCFTKEEGWKSMGGETWEVSVDR